MYRLIMAWGLLGAICLVTGCGSSGSEATSAPLSRAQFIKQADTICTKVKKEREGAIAAWKEEYPGGPAKAEAHYGSGLKEVIAPSFREEAERLEALTPPERNQAEIHKLIGSLKAASTVLAEKGTAGIAHSRIPDFEQKAAAYGFKVCRSP